jgi:hypothetical protein
MIRARSRAWVGQTARDVRPDEPRPIGQDQGVQSWLLIVGSVLAVVTGIVWISGQT